MRTSSLAAAARSRSRRGRGQLALLLTRTRAPKLAVCRSTRCAASSETLRAPLACSHSRSRSHSPSGSPDIADSSTLDMRRRGTSTTLRVEDRARRTCATGERNLEARERGTRGGKTHRPGPADHTRSRRRLHRRRTQQEVPEEAHRRTRRTRRGRRRTPSQAAHLRPPHRGCSPGSRCAASRPSCRRRVHRRRALRPSRCRARRRREARRRRTLRRRRRRAHGRRTGPGGARRGRRRRPGSHGEARRRRVRWARRTRRRAEEGEGQSRGRGGRVRPRGCSRRSGCTGCSWRG